MTKFWKRKLDGIDVEAELRAARPQARSEFVAALAAHVREERVRGRGGSFRLAFAGALTVAMLTSLAAVGGLGYAASSVGHAVKSVAHLVSPAGKNNPIVVSGLTAGGDQYRPGYGFGDKNHNHTGPPGLNKKGGKFAPPVQARLINGIWYVTTSFTTDEQAHLTISVLHGKNKLTLVKNKSKIGQGVKGPPTPNLQYLVLVPRTIPMTLAIPNGKLIPGQQYFVRVRARDPSGNISFLKIPFKI